MHLKTKILYKEKNMSLEPLTLYKLMTLYMLNKVNFPLTKNQLLDFFLSKDYTN